VRCRNAGICFWVGLVALIPIRAYRPLELFLFVLPITAVVAWRIRRAVELRGEGSGGAGPVPFSRSAIGPMRFSLRDLFLATLLVGMTLVPVLAAWRAPGGFSSGWMPATAACLVALCASLMTAVLVPRKRLLWIIGLWAVVTVVFALHALVLPDWLELGYWFFGAGLSETLLGVGLGCAGFCVLLIVVLCATRWSGAESSMLRLRRRGRSVRFVLAAPLAVLLVLLAVVYGHMLRGPRAPELGYEGANSYPQILAAAEKLKALNGSELSVAELAKEPATAGGAAEVAELHVSLLTIVEQPGYVPLDLADVSGPDYLAMLLPNIQALHGVARMWSAEAETAAATGRFDEAIRYSVGSMQMGNTVSRGGLIVHMMIGVAIEGIGVDALCKLRSGLTAAQLRTVFDELKRIEQLREPSETTLARDAACDDAMYGWLPSFQRATETLIGRPPRWSKGHVFHVANRRDALLRLLQADLAIRLFLHQHGQLPEQLDEVVPEYLDSVPVDPFSGQPLIYRRTDDEFVLYSVGADGTDDGGVFGSWADYFLGTGYDLDLDMGER
jgi:hypothetical protein